jgi:hypothetical protein
MQGVVRLRDENLQLRQSVEERRQIGEEEEIRHFKQELILRRHIAAFQDRRNNSGLLELSEDRKNVLLKAGG